jgi:hypothetical protein
MNETYQLRFRPLSDRGRAFVFPCDEVGHVDMDRLSERARVDYFYARAVIGRELTLPVVQRGPVA